MKGKKSIIALLIMVVLSVFSIGCVGNMEAVIGRIEEQTETMVVIRIEESTKKATLKLVMDDLKKSEELQFEMKDGMIFSVNGKAQEGEYYWMIFTSDKEMSSSAFGTFSYLGKDLYSAIVGVKDLPVTKGEIYVLSYQKMEKF